MNVALFIAAIIVVAAATAALMRMPSIEAYTQDTGADWLRGAWETLVPGECVDFGIIVDRLGTRKGQYFYSESPSDLTVYREILAKGSDGFMRIDKSWGSSRAEVALNPASKYHRALTAMDEMSEKYRKELSGLNIWFLPGGAPARFDRLSVGVISGTSIAANGVHVWKVDERVANRPRESAHAVISLFCYAKLLTDLDQATRDFQAMESHMKREDILTATTLISVDESTKRATGVIKAELQAAQDQLWRAAKINSDAADVVRQRALKLSKAAGDDTDTAKQEMKASATADARRVKVDSDNVGLARTGNMYRMEVADVNADAASIENTTEQMKVTNWAEYEEALGKIDELSRERVKLDSRTAELSGKLANMQERVAYLSHPSRMDANKAALARALDDLKKATAQLEKNLTDAETVSSDKSYLERAVDDMKTKMTNAQANSTQATIASEQAYKQVGDLRGRLEAAKLFSQEKAKLESALTGERSKEQNARDAMSAANTAAAVTDGNPRLIMCTADYAAARLRAQEEAERRRREAEEAATKEQAVRDRLAREAAARPPPPPPPATPPPPASQPLPPASPQGTTLIVANKELKYNGTVVSGNSGNVLRVTVARQPDLYKAKEGFVSFNVGGLALAHFGGVVSLRNYMPNNLDFAWKMFWVSNFEFVVYNEYQNLYLSYDSGADKVVISPRMDRWSMSSPPSSDFFSKGTPPTPPPPPPPPAAPKCNPDACNRVLDSWNAKNWAYTSSTFPECNLCPVVQNPKRIPGGTFDAPKPVPAPAPAPVAPKRVWGRARKGQTFGSKQYKLIIGGVDCKAKCEADPDCWGMTSSAASCALFREPETRATSAQGGFTSYRFAPSEPAPAWFEEDGQRYNFVSYKETKLDRDDDEHKSAARCLAICKADPECWIMSHYKPERKMSTNQQGICNLGTEGSSLGHIRNGDGRSFSAIKK